MNPQREKKQRSPLPPMDLPASLLPALPATAEGPATSTASDCLYQFAALTAGAFLLVTLL
jgi:hypothetical protein